MLMSEHRILVLMLHQIHGVHHGIKNNAMVFKVWL